MPAPINTLLIDGSFGELSTELAQYLDDVRRKTGDESSNIQSEVAPLLEKDQKDEVLKKLVAGSQVLNVAPEKEFTAAYNLLIHLISQSPNIDRILPRVCQNLSRPVTSSSNNGTALTLTVLTTIFNILPQDNDTRYHVFLTILRVIRGTSSFDLLKSQLKNLDPWIQLWELDEEDQQKLYLSISEVAEESGDKEQGYFYLLRALRTIPSSESSSQTARDLSLKALKIALSNPLHFDFQDLTALDSIQALRKSDGTFFELLEIFNADQLEEFNDFEEEHHGWLDAQGLPHSILLRKIRLLTLASLAAASQSRALPYQHISRSLQIPPEEVEMWVIDTIKGGLIEGRLSQLDQTFLIHRSTYRVFGEKQWTEVAGRLDTWRSSLEAVLQVVRLEREKMIREKERELRDMDNKVGSFGSGGPRKQQRDYEVGAD